MKLYHLISILPALLPWPCTLAAEDAVASAAQFETASGTHLSKAPEAPFKIIACGTAGLLRDGIAVFYPQGMTPESAPASLSLVERPRLTKPLLADWKLRPVFSGNGTRFRASVRVLPGTDLYGGGEVTGPLRRNGTSIKVWNTDSMRYRKDNGARLYQSHPWIMGLRPDGSALGLLFDSSWKAELDCTNDISFTAEGPAFPVIVIEAGSPEGVLKSLGKLTGRMELPPRWALGYQQCRWSYYPDSKVREVADGFRSRNIPCDVIWLDIDYMDAFRVFTFNKNYFPDPKGLNDYLHSKGFKTVWMIDPGVKVDSKYSVYTDGRDKDVFVKSADGKEFHGTVWPGACAFPDFTRPETRSWWVGYFPAYLANGIDGVWNDMNEPSVFKGPDGTMPEDNLHRGGDGLVAGTHRQYHNAYGMLMTRATREGMLAAKPDKRPFVLTRSNFLGGQRYAATWTGDNSSTDYYMKVSVPMSLTLGLSGQPFSGPDLGGFADKVSPELWAQWVGFGAFLPFARGHAIKSQSSKEPWSVGPETEQTARISHAPCKSKRSARMRHPSRPRCLCRE